MVQPTDFYSQEEYEAALEERVANPSEARAEYAANAGAEDRSRAWVLTPWDTWERNPYYVGPPAPHPEDDADDAMREAAGHERVTPYYVAPIVETDDDIPF